MTSRPALMARTIAGASVKASGKTHRWWRHKGRLWTGPYNEIWLDVGAGLKSRPAVTLSRTLELQALPDVLECFDQHGHRRVVVKRGRREAQTLRAARDGREVDRLHVDAVALQKCVGSPLAQRRVAD